MVDERNLPPPATRTEGEDETLDMPEGLETFSPGQVLGERYQILEMLGRGGMGEVWQAFDLKLRVEVALKALRSDLFKSERRLELLRQEVRAAREVMSPNVCRIFDLIEIEGRELVSMEYVDGATLLGVLQERGPLDLKEAQDIASQFLAGLEAIHKVGLIHRDIKPENIMLTRAGRVVVMDFGLARQDTEGGGSVSGTPAYMAPEQAAGQTLDARADVYSAGVVLAEMVSPEGIKNIQSRQSVWEGVRSEPAKLPDSPWAPVLKKAVAKDREQRYHTAHTLTRALEDITLRVEGAEDLYPYPGLASFTEKDAEYFFGREAEVEQMWRKLEGPPRMLSLVGPSGAGKSSFVRAGLLPARHDGWAFLVVTPGEQPFANLGGAITRALAGDLEALEMMVLFAEPEVAIEVFQRWRRQHEHAILVVDQFEELFTLNPEKTQASVAGLLGRLPIEADVHVLVSMRDDFLGHCHEHSPLTPMFSDLTFLGTPVGGALRRAVVRPATKCGYRFEDDELIEEMLAEVEGERGALPLLAFALARLWEKRDRETGLLTRQAYNDIGGVGGALARHAEATIDRIGSDRIAIVRELFRNLVTTEGTRAVREWDELLSIFSDSRSESPSESPEEVLRALIDARLLTSYEVREEDEEPTRRVEIIHESLLANWPRLVRWQTQDADAAQLRDQLRQAAHTWDGQGRSDDTLWTGSAYQEFALWRERYPGGLTEIEEAYAAAMTTHAKRRKRHRRIAVAAAFVVLLAVLGIVDVSRQQAVAEARRAEAARLVTLGQTQLDDYPTAAIAYATASLGVADSMQARLLALEALWRGPPARILSITSGQGEGQGYYRHTISPDGRWLAATGTGGTALLISNDGGPPKLLRHPVMGGTQYVSFGPDSRTLVTVYEKIRLWSVPEGELIRTIESEMSGGVTVLDDRLIALGRPREDPFSLVVKSWSLDGDGHETLGTVQVHSYDYYAWDPAGRWLAYVQDGNAYLRPLQDPAAANEEIVDLPNENIGDITFSNSGHHLVLTTQSGGVIVWPMPGTPGVPLRAPEVRNPEELFYPQINAAGSLLVQGSSADKAAYLSHLDGPPDTDHTTLRRADVDYVWDATFDPDSRWLATLHESSISFWPLGIPRVRVFREAIPTGGGSLSVSTDGRWLVSCAMTDGARLWPLMPGVGVDRKVGDWCVTIAMHPTREQLVVAGFNGPVALVAFDSDQTSELIGRVGGIPSGAAFDSEGRLFAVGTVWAQEPKDMLLRVVDLKTGDMQVINQLTDPVENLAEWNPYSMGIGRTEFGLDGTLYSSGRGGVRRWNLDESKGEALVEAEVSKIDVSSDGRYLLAASGELDAFYVARGELRLFDLEKDTSRLILTHGGTVNAVAFDPSGRIIVTGDGEGVVRVGSMSGEEPHLLLGHEGRVTGAVVSPDGRWVFTLAGGEIRQWPMPDLDKTPLHALPHDELIAKLHSLTNLRVVRDAESSTGWKVEVGPFPGWAVVPEW